MLRAWKKKSRTNTDGSPHFFERGEIARDRTRSDGAPCARGDARRFDVAAREATVRCRRENARNRKRNPKTGTADREVRRKGGAGARAAPSPPELALALVTGALQQLPLLVLAHLLAALLDDVAQDLTSSVITSHREAPRFFERGRIVGDRAPGVNRRTGFDFGSWPPLDSALRPKSAATQAGVGSERAPATNRRFLGGSADPPSQRFNRWRRERKRSGASRRTPRTRRVRRDRLVGRDRSSGRGAGSGCPRP